MDPKKAEAVERLGMGVSSAGAKQNARFTHSAITEISSIEQEEPSGGGGRNSQGRVLQSVTLFDNEYRVV